MRYYTQYNFISSLISIEFSKGRNDLSYRIGKIFIMRFNLGKKLIAKIAAIGTQCFLTFDFELPKPKILSLFWR